MDHTKHIDNLECTGWRRHIEHIDHTNNIEHVGHLGRTDHVEHIEHTNGLEHIQKHRTHRTNRGR